MPDVDRRELEELRSEQARLRDEIERLRQEQNGSGKKESDEKKPDGDPSKDGKQDDKKNGQKDEKKDDKKGDKKEEEEKKPPLRQRLSAWIRTHPLLTVALVIGFIVLLIAGWFYWQYLDSYESTDDAEIDGHVNQISPRISGTVVGVYVEDTQSVVKGQTVVDLDPRDYQVALQQARANYAQALAGLSAQNPSVPITQTTQATFGRQRAPRTWIRRKRQ